MDIVRNMNNKNTDKTRNILIVFIILSMIVIFGVSVLKPAEVTNDEKNGGTGSIKIGKKCTRKNI